MKVLFLAASVAVAVATGFAAPAHADPTGTSSASDKRAVRDRIVAWFITKEPHPDLSRLDRLDGLTHDEGRYGLPMSL